MTSALGPKLRLCCRWSLGLLMLVFLPAQAMAGEVTVPFDIAVGPSFHLFSGAIEEDQPIHYGLTISTAAILDEAFIKANQHRAPKKFKGLIKDAEEIRLRPWFIPDTFFLSPQHENTSIYGVVWRPIGLGLPLILKPVRFALSFGLDISYAYIDSTTLGTTHFFRPGLDLRAELEVPLGEYVFLSGGWTSFFHLPQTLGESPFANPFDGGGDKLWHIGQFFGLLHIRFPYDVRL